MRIAYITNEYGRASDTFIRGEVEQLRALGITVHTFSPRRPGDDEVIGDEVRRAQQTTDYLLDPGRLRRNVARMAAGLVRAGLTTPARLAAAIRLALRTATPGVRAHVWQGAYLMEAALLVRLMRSHGVQHLHNHMGSASAYVTMLASELSGIPYSLTIHGSHIFFEPRRWVLGDKIVRSSFTACISDFCRSQCMIFTPYEHWHKLHVVRCGLDRRFIEAPAVPLPERCRLVSVGRLTEEKGYPLLVEAAARLLQRGHEFTLTLVGDGPLRRDLADLTRRLGVSRQVELAGWKSTDEVRQQLLRARAFVLPSYAEGIPVVAMEALALGRPVLCTRVGGIPELVEHGVSGWLVAPGSVDALTAGLQRLLSASTEDLSAMGRAGAARVRAMHDARAEARKLAALLRHHVGRAAG